MSERQIHSVSMEIAGRTLTLEAGRFAEQANGAVVVRYGDTMLLATAVASKEPRADADFFPLTVDTKRRCMLPAKFLAVSSSAKGSQPIVRS